MSVLASTTVPESLATALERLAVPVGASAVVGLDAASAAIAELVRLPQAGRGDDLPVAASAAALDGVAGASAAVLLGPGVDERHAVSARLGLVVRWTGSLGGTPVAVLGAAHDDHLARRIAAGPLGLLLDPSVDVASADPAALRGLRVAVVTYEFSGVTNNGGIGTAYTGLAQALADAGAQVEVLATGFHGYGPTSADDQPPVHHPGLRVHRLDRDGSRDVLAPYWDVRRAHAAYAWLREQHEREPFDVIHVPESRGHGAFILSAKRAGLAFQEAVVVVGVHSPMLWQHEGNLLPFDSFDSLVADHLERVSLRDADVLLAPSAYMYDYLDARGYEVPGPRFVQQNLHAHDPVEQEGSAAGDVAAGRRGDRLEVVFFGRLETRKGLDAFLDAVDLLAGAHPDRDLAITFLGRPGIEDEPPEETIHRRAAAWPWPVAIHTDLGQREALAYLRSRRCVLAMSSRVENSPMTVLEALELGRPFVAADTGGTAELVHPEDRERVMVTWHAEGVLAPMSFDEPHEAPPAHALAEALERVLADPRPVRHAVEPDVTLDAHLRWHAALAMRAPVAAPPSAASVTIDVVPVAVGGAPGGLAAAVAEATASHVLLLSERHELLPDARERLRGIAARTGAGVVTFAVDADGGRATEVAPGGPALMGAVHDVFGSGSALVRRHLLASTAVLPADAPDDVALHAALAALALEGELPLVVPESLARERRAGDEPGPLRDAASISEAPAVRPDQRRARFVLRPYRAQLPPQLRELPALLRAAALRSGVEAETRRHADERVLELDGYLRDASARVVELEAHFADAMARVHELDHLRKDAEAAVLARDRELAVWRAGHADCSPADGAAGRTARPRRVSRRAWVALPPVRRAAGRALRRWRDGRG